MKHTFKRNLTILFALTLLFSCKKSEQLGPELNGIFGELVVVTTLDRSNAAPDFSAGDKVYFTAAFENDADWTLTLTGATTGAVKTFTGVGKALGTSNTMWDGTADSAPSFGLENVTASLSFKNSTEVLTTTLTVVGNRDLDEGGVLVSNFNVSKMYCVCGPTNPNGWPSDWPVTVNTNTSYVRPDGNNYMFMSGTAWQGTPITPYVDFMTIEAKNADVNYGDYFPLYADPSKVYFNVMVYNTGTPGTWLKIMLTEEGGTVRYVDIYPNWTGWKLLSYNYTELKCDVTITPRPNRVQNIQFVLLSTLTPPESATVTTAYDHVIFTHNKPYQP